MRDATTGILFAIASETIIGAVSWSEVTARILAREYRLSIWSRGAGPGIDYILFKVAGTDQLSEVSAHIPHFRGIPAGYSGTRPFLISAGASASIRAYWFFNGVRLAG